MAPSVAGDPHEGADIAVHRTSHRRSNDHHGHGQTNERRGLAPVQAARAICAVVRGSEAHDAADRLCGAAQSLTGVDGVVLSAWYGPGMLVPIGASNSRAAVAEQVEFTAGEGPILHTHLSAGHAVVTDVTDSEDVSRRPWATWAALMGRATSYRSALSVPVPIPTEPARPRVPLALAFYSGMPLAASSTPVGAPVRTISGALSAAYQVAETVHTALGELSTARSSGQPVWLDSERALRRAQVWLTEELLIDVNPQLEREQALVELRTFAQLHGASVDQIAADVVTGQLAAEDVIGL